MLLASARRMVFSLYFWDGDEIKLQNLVIWGDGAAVGMLSARLILLMSEFKKITSDLGCI